MASTSPTSSASTSYIPNSHLIIHIKRSQLDPSLHTFPQWRHHHPFFLQRQQIAIASGTWVRHRHENHCARSPSSSTRTSPGSGGGHEGGPRRALGPDPTAFCPRPRARIGRRVDARAVGAAGRWRIAVAQQPRSLDRLPARPPARPLDRSPDYSTDCPIAAYPAPRPLACRSPARTAPGNEPRGACEYPTVTRREHRSWARCSGTPCCTRATCTMRARAPANRRAGLPPAASAARAGRALRAGPVLARRARYGRGHPLRRPRDARGRAPPVGPARRERDACGVPSGDEMQTIHELAAAFTAPSATAPSTQLGPILGRLPVRVHRIQHASVAKSSTYPSSRSLIRPARTRVRRGDLHPDGAVHQYEDTQPPALGVESSGGGLWERRSERQQARWRRST
ncbi:hypothetical protein GGX14DRAFT_600883 [Mycena pura]|uniref:Uncharacterized protein n=1 Tax=Mycena pura TaxID=153505 RepID=A0AAD6UST6_9AGAR|nr:hypothetical protein GGX14DRAFT_600883 [Mycena pura]